MVSSASLGGIELLVALLANPVEIVRALAIIHLDPDFEVLGPFGTYQDDEAGTTNATLLLSTALVLWVVVAAWFVIELLRKRIPDKS